MQTKRSLINQMTCHDHISTHGVRDHALKRPDSAPYAAKKERLEHTAQVRRSTQRF